MSDQPERTLAALHDEGTYRQSLIASFDSCPRRALYSLLDERRSPFPMAARGTLFHRWHHAAIEEMRAHGERTFPVEQGMELLAEVLAQRDVPAEDVVPLTMREMRWLRVLATKWCLSMELSIERLVDVERRLSAEILLPDGSKRIITGQLDTLFAGPGEGEAGSLDAKTGYARPSQPRDEDARDGRGLTELGWVQSLIYAFLVFANYPSVQRFWFREWHVLWGEAREAVLDRWEVERMTDVLAAQVSLLDQAIAEGPDSERWVPSAGAHCFGGETRFLTDQGVRTLRDACGERVRILNRHGRWEEGEIHHFGRQSLVRMEFDDGTAVRVTPDHRWWALKPAPNHGYRQTGERITTVEVDRVPLARMAEFPAIDPEGVRHGIVFGDGHLRVNRGWSKILLQPHKAELARYFSSEVVQRSNNRWSADVKPRTDGTVEITMQPVAYKALPTACSPEYARGFIAGLIATDGSVGASGDVSIACEGLERARRIAELAHLAGCVTRRFRVDTRPTNYSPVGTITREMVKIPLLPASAPLVRSDQQARINPKQQWRLVYQGVEALEDAGVDEVYCVVAPGSESFTLANGVVTSNCALCAMPRDCPIREQVGIPASEADARRLAQEWVVAGEVRKERVPYLKGWVDAHGPVEIPHSRGRRVVGWDTSSEKRSFGVFEPREPLEAPEDAGLAEAARESGALVEAGA